MERQGFALGRHAAVTAPKPRWYVVIKLGVSEADQAYLPVLDAQAPGCGGMWGLDPPCGGCDACMHAQAVYYGYEVRPIVPAGMETLGDATARVVRATLAEPPRPPRQAPVEASAVDEAF